MQIRSTLVLTGILILGCLNAVSGSAQELSDAGCAVSGDAGILQPTERSDMEQALKIVSSEASSVTLSGPLAGVVIDASCLTSGAVRRERIEAALLRMLERFATCDAFMRLPDLENAKALLKNTQIHCANDAAHAPIGKSVLTVALPGGIQQAAGSRPDAPLRITLNGAKDAPDNRLDTPTQGVDGPGAQWSLDNLASILGHELFHGTSNATAWHIENRGKEFEQSGCTRSLYADRIYALSAICFPYSESGRFYYDSQTGAASCPAVCESAMGSVDASLNEQLKVDAGQSLVALALSPEEASMRCEKVQKLSKYVSERTEALGLARKKILDLRAGWLEKEPAQSEWLILTRRANFLLDWTYRLNEGYETVSDARAVLKKERNILRMARSPQAPELIRILDEIGKWIDPPPPEGMDLFSRPRAGS